MRWAVLVLRHIILRRSLLLQFSLYLTKYCYGADKLKYQEYLQKLPQINV